MSRPKPPANKKSITVYLDLPVYESIASLASHEERQPAAQLATLIKKLIVPNLPEYFQTEGIPFDLVNTSKAIVPICKGQQIKLDTTPQNREENELPPSLQTPGENTGALLGLPPATPVFS